MFYARMSIIMNEFESFTAEANFKSQFRNVLSRDTCA